MSKDRIAGVGALIVSPEHRVLTVQELTDSLRTVKERGMRTHPMESSTQGEIPAETMGRLFTEEIVLPEGVSLEDRGLLCTVQINYGLWAEMFLYQSPVEFGASIGTAQHEVASPGWIPMQEVIESPIGNRRFRPGLRETVLAYQERLASNGSFKPRTFFNTLDGPAVLARLRSPRVRNAEVYPSVQRLAL